MAGGYKFGGNVNIGHNPSFAPQLTGSYIGNPHSNLVMGYNNNVEGNYNAVFGTLSAISGAADSQANFVSGYQSKVAGGVANTAIGYDCAVSGTSSYSVALGFESKVRANSSAGVAIGYGVASGTIAIGIGYESTGSSEGALGIGYNAKATAFAATAIGSESNATATEAIGIGGTASGDKAIAIGNQATGTTTACTVIGKGTLGAGRKGGFRLNANGGASSTSSYQICQSLGATTNATPTKIYLADDNTNGNLIIDTRTCVHFEVIVQGTSPTSSTVGCIYKLEGVVNRANSASDNPAFLGSVTKTVIHEEDAGMDAAITINNTNKCLDLEVTGKAATNLNWLATWHLHQNE